MDIETIRTLRRADPFKPFRLLLQDGRKLSVERASFLAISPTGASVVYALEEGGFEILRVSQVREAVVDESLRDIGRRAK
ncbi:MAG: hypothetical protein H0T11_09505 [Chthoniobacterales bacterium]|nr:hypothetical protein [Chthoniobacterales bacterium]